MDRHFLVALLSFEEHDGVSAEFKDYLAAGATRRARHIIGGDNGDGAKGKAGSFGLLYSGKNGGALSAIGQAIGGIFHIAAGEYLALIRQHSSTDAKVGVARIRPLQGVASGREKFIPFGRRNRLGRHGITLHEFMPWN